MKKLKTLVEEKIQQALFAAYGEDAHLSPEVTQSTQVQFGDYQSNDALKLGSKYKTSPRAVAEKIVSSLDTSDSKGCKMFSKVEIAGPGFINLTIDPLFLSSEITKMLHDPKEGVFLPKPQKIVVEFSSPNTAKELHVGHLRSTLIGDCIARLFEFLGHEVVRLNHVGDWGTQFGMLIAYMQEHEPAVLNGQKEADLPMLMQWYKASKKQFDADEVFKKRSQLEVVKLQQGDPSSKAAWEKICHISRLGYQEIYDVLDVKLIERGESFYNPFLQGVVSDLENKGMITLSQGAKCIYLDGFEGRDGTLLPVIIQKSDGGYNYDTTDFAALRHRIEVEKVDRIIYVVDAGQSLHFQMLFKAAEKAGYLDPSQVRVDHVAFGLVLGPDGKKFKTRSGETEKLIDLLHEASKHAKKVFKEHLSDMSVDEFETSAAILGIDAVKYADLSLHRIKDYTFSYERMLRLDGNTAAFLLYAYVRTQSIKRKVGRDTGSLAQKSSVVLQHSSEIALAMHLRQFGEAIDETVLGLVPHRLADYLYNLAEKFHAFFRDCRVEGSEKEESRLLLCEMTGRILKRGLNILGLKTLEKM